MTAHAAEHLFALARRLDACDQPAAAVRVRGLPLDRGNELLPLLEVLVDAAEQRVDLRAGLVEALSWLDTARPENAPDTAEASALAEVRERLHVLVDDPRCGWCCSPDHTARTCTDRRRKADA